MEIAQGEVFRRLHAIAGRGAHVGERREILFQRGGGRPEAVFRPGRAGEHGLEGARAFRNAGQAAKAGADGGDPAGLDAEVEGGTERRDILIEAFGDLVTAEAGLVFGQGDRLDEFAGRAVLLAVVEKELLERDVAAGLAPAQVQPGAEGEPLAILPPRVAASRTWTEP